MTIDLLAIGVTAVFAWLGWRSGALSQCLRVTAAVAAFFAAAPVATLLKTTLAPDRAVSGPVLEGVLLIVSGIGVYLAIAVLAWLFVRALWAASDGISLLDRMGGLALGVLKSAVVVYFVVAAVSLMRGALERVDGEDVLHVRDSALLGFVDRHNVLAPWRFRDLDRLHDALEADWLLERRRGVDLGSDHPKAQELLEGEKIRRLAEREGLTEAAVHDRYWVTLGDATVREYLNDDRFVARLRMPEWERLVRKLREAPEREPES